MDESLPLLNYYWLWHTLP